MATPQVRSRTSGFPGKWPYRASDFQRMDPTDDSVFYDSPRFVTHIDDRCIAHLSEYYGSVLPKPDPTNKPRVLDIASSWISHLPEDWSPSNSHVHGIGMNKAELAENRALSEYAVANLNSDPQSVATSFEQDASELYDAAICSVSIDYLIKPREMLASLTESLKPGGTVHFSFSNRCFPTKVVGRWLRIDEEERCDMVADYLHFAGTSQDSDIQPGQLYDNIEIVTVLPPSRRGDPLYVVRAKRR